MTIVLSPATLFAEDDALVAAALRRAHEQAEMVDPPFFVDDARATPRVKPVLLAKVIEAFSLNLIEVPSLSRAAAGAELHKLDLDFPELLEDVTPLAGFLYANMAGGLILLRAEDPIVRRRFSAAHELGHFLMHWDPQEGPLVLDDEPQAVAEEEQVEYEAMERQANRFAAEILIPENICRGAFDYYASEGGSPRFVENHIATQLLVSRQAIRWRLESLGLSRCLS